MWEQQNKNYCYDEIMNKFKKYISSETYPPL